jgi:hypothetical protein
LIKQKKKGGGCHPPPIALRHNLHLGLDVNREVQTRERVEDAVQALAALGERDEVALVHLGEGVVQRPEVARGEVFVQGLFPLVENVRDHRLANRASAIAAEDKGASLIIGQGRLGVLGDASLVAGPHIAQLANRTGNNLRQVAQDVDGVTASQRDFVMEREVAANERSVARANASGEALVVRVAEPDNRARLRALLAHIDLEKAEVALTETSGRVQLLLDVEASVLHLLAEDADEISVRDGLVALRSVGGSNFGEVSEADLGIIGTANVQVNRVVHR